jgi:hypothetical protein
MRTGDPSDLVAHLMRQLAAMDPGEARLADPRVLARRARLLDRLARYEGAERATRPVLVAALVGPAMAVAISTLLVLSRWPMAGLSAVAVGVLAAAAAMPLVLADE